MHKNATFQTRLKRKPQDKTLCRLNGLVSSSDRRSDLKAPVLHVILFIPFTTVRYWTRYGWTRRQCEDTRKRPRIRVRAPIVDPVMMERCVLLKLRRLISRVKWPALTTAILERAATVLVCDSPRRFARIIGVRQRVGDSQQDDVDRRWNVAQCGRRNARRPEFSVNKLRLYRDVTRNLVFCGAVATDRV